MDQQLAHYMIGVLWYGTYKGNTLNIGQMDKNGIQNNILGVGWGEHQINIQHQIYQSAHILPYIKAIILIHKL